MPAAALEVYLNYVLPWGQEHAHTYKCVTTFWTRANGQRNDYPLNEAVRGYDELLALIEDRMTWREADVYLALGVQKVAKPEASRDGLAVKAVRTSANMASFNSLFIDVDLLDPAKPKDRYKTTAEAEAGLAAFLEASGMPAQSLRVNSGSGGFHIYWCFGEPVPADEWLRYANALKASAAHYGFKIDEAVTADAARILRIPTTLNHKHKPPVECQLDIGIAQQRNLYTVDALAPALNPFMVARKKAATGSGTVSSITSNFTSGMDGQAKPVPIEKLAVNCLTIAHTLETGGAGKDEPAWHADIYLATFTSEPSEAAHDLSRGHAEYDHARTERKLEESKRARTANPNLGWPKCAEIAAHRVNSKCQQCPLLSHGKSPFHFAQPNVPPVQPVQDDDEIMPPSYLRNRDMHVLKRDDTRYIPVVPYPLLDAFIDKETHEPVIKYIAGGKEHFGAVSTAKQSPVNLAEAWTRATCGSMLLNSKTAGPFIMSFVQRLHSLGDRRKLSSSAMGWDGECFVFDQVYSPTGARAVYRPREIIELNYEPRGELKPWQNAMEMIYGNPVMEVLVASAFAAPLVSLLAPYSLIMSIYSPASGYGKTTAISTAQAVWAQPEKMSQIQDTTNSVMGKLAALRHLPLYWDELKLQDDMQEIVKIIFRVVSGRDKTRMRQDATLRRQAGVARTMMVVCSNQSVSSMAIEATEGTDAGGLRVFEMEADPLKRRTGVHGESLLLQLDNNYGNAGALYSRFLVNNRASIAKILDAVREMYDDQANFEDRERFWKATMISITTGAILANQAGLTKFDIPAIQQRLLATLAEQRMSQGQGQTYATTTTHAAVGLFNEMLNEWSGERHLIVTETISARRGRPTVSSNMAGPPQPQEYKEIYAQQGTADGRVLVKKAALNKWMKDHRRHHKHVIALLRQDYTVLEKRATLCAGIPLWKLGQIDCYEFIPLSHTPSDLSASSDSPAPN